MLLVLEGRAVAAEFAAGPATVHDDPALLGAVLHRYRLEHATARVGAVSRVHVDVQRVEAEGAVIAVPAAGQRRYGRTALGASERLVGAAAREAFHAPSIASAASPPQAGGYPRG